MEPTQDKTKQLSGASIIPPASIYADVPDAEIIKQMLQICSLVNANRLDALGLNEAPSIRTDESEDGR